MNHPLRRYPHPGKYEGQKMLTLVAHRRDANGESVDSFGDASEGEGRFFAVCFKGKYGMRYYHEDPQGFVEEVIELFYRLESEEAAYGTWMFG